MLDLPPERSHEAADSSRGARAQRPNRKRTDAPRRPRQQRWELASAEARPTIVLVHGGFVDGSGWEGVYKLLRKDGYEVSIVQNPTTSLADDVAVTQARDRRAERPRDSRRPFVRRRRDHRSRQRSARSPGSVYIAAFAPDKGESVSTLIKNPPPGAPVPPILPPQDGFLFLDKAKFAASFAADVDAGRAAFMADSQVPWGVEALGGAISEPAWKTKPSWYLVATDDQMIPPRRAAVHVQARGRDGRRGQGQPRGLRVAAGSGGEPDRAGGVGGQCGFSQGIPAVKIAGSSRHRDSRPVA